MANQIIKDARLWIGGYNLSGDVNRLAMDLSAELLDNTTLEDSARPRLSGLLVSAVQCDGFWDAGAGEPDDVVDGYFALADVPVSVCPIAAAAAGSRAFTFRAAIGDYQRGASVGDMFKFTAGAEGSGGVPLVRGLVLNNAAQTATGAGTAYQLGALSAAQSLYASLHVLAVSGTVTPTLTCKIQSDDNEAMTSATDRITFAAATAIGYEWASVAGAVTDDWWRAYFTISGTDPSFLFALVAGIR